MQIYHESKEANMPVMRPGLFTFSFKIPKLLLGSGQYIASVALNQGHPRPGEAPQAYCVWDRRIEFEVCSELDYKLTRGCYMQYSEAGIIEK